MKTTNLLKAVSLLLIVVIAVSCRSNRSTTGRQYPRNSPTETPTKTYPPVYADGGNLPPGQAKKVYGGQSAKAYAPGQRKKYGNHYPLVIVYSPAIVIKKHSDGRYYYVNTAGYTYWKGYDGRYYIDEKHLKGIKYEVSDYDDPRDRESDLLKVGRLEGTQGWPAVVNYLSKLKLAATPGTKFNYNTTETSLAGLALQRAIGKTLSQYLSEKIWKPFGMHSDANWVKSRSLGIELGGCCISATLRDYALLGSFALNNGIDLAGKQVLDPDWMKRSTTPARSSPHYGYYWWLGSSPRYFASGSFGQQIEIDPSRKIVIAVQSHWPTAYSNYYVGYLDAMIAAVMNKL